TLSGIVSITGSAAHPQFARYEIAFAYDPNPTDTWFEIQPPATTQASEGLLATWDTRHIADGTYMLRLRVYPSDASAPLETIVHGIIVANTPKPTATPTATSSPLGTAAPATPTAELPATLSSGVPAPAATQLSPAATPPTAPLFDLAPYTSAFFNGALYTFGFFLLLGLYALLRDRIRRPIRRWLRRIVSDIRKP
ncbi:MAG: hypothetical protein HZB20_12480, partial [Chloroflexi bacterium]|nr:hypothetical protein [Chloroflexota bacterium]